MNGKESALHQKFLTACLISLGSRGIGIFKYLENMPTPPKKYFVFRKFDSRDLDSLPTRREAAAVDEWLQSGKRLHAMRDNPYHW